MHSQPLARGALALVQSDSLDPLFRLELLLCGRLPILLREINLKFGSRILRWHSS
jgi:hypothetical protein